jgi:hypothetical protein
LNGCASQLVALTSSKPSERRDCPHLPAYTGALWLLQYLSAPVSPFQPMADARDFLERQPSLEMVAQTLYMLRGSSSVLAMSLGPDLRLPSGRLPSGRLSSGRYSSIVLTATSIVLTDDDDNCWEIPYGVYFSMQPSAVLRCYEPVGAQEVAEYVLDPDTDHLVFNGQSYPVTPDWLADKAFLTLPELAEVMRETQYVGPYISPAAALYAAPFLGPWAPNVGGPYVPVISTTLLGIPVLAQPAQVEPQLVQAPAPVPVAPVRLAPRLTLPVLMEFAPPAPAPSIDSQASLYSMYINGRPTNPILRAMPSGERDRLQLLAFFASGYEDLLEEAYETDSMHSADTNF